MERIGNPAAINVHRARQSIDAIVETFLRPLFGAGSGPIFELEIASEVLSRTLGEVEELLERGVLPCTLRFGDDGVDGQDGRTSGVVS